jgi:hypothetical protein
LTHHRSLREHLVHRAEAGHPPVFVPSNDPPLVEFARLFEASGWYSFDVNKFISADGWVPVRQLSVEIVRSVGDPVEASEVGWTPVLPGRDPRAGFRYGADSAVWGTSPTVSLPPDSRVEALLLLVTTNYAHLSASRETSPPLIRGAVEEQGDEFTYVQLAEAS